MIINRLVNKMKSKILVAMFLMLALMPLGVREVKGDDVDISGFTEHCTGWVDNHILTIKPDDSGNEAKILLEVDDPLKAYIDNNYITEVVIAPNGDRKVKVTSCEEMFNGCSGLTSVDLSGLDTSGVTSMSKMFSMCSQLTNVNVSSLDTSKVSTMAQMFDYCEALKSLDLSSFVVQEQGSDKVNITSMFNGCHELERIYIDSSKWNINSTSFSDDPFKNCYNLVGGDFTDIRSAKAVSTKEKIIDRDTYKSCLPSKTIIVGDASTPGSFFDMKAHEMSETTAANQDFLANLHPAAKGKKIKVISRFDIYPRRDLTTTEKGSVNTFTWNDLKNTTPGTIYAVCYSQNGGAYYLTGTVDAKGTAAFPNFIVNEATSITVFQRI